MEFERLVNASGPTGGKVLMANGEEPAAVGHRPLRRLPRRKLSRLLLPRLLHVFPEVRPPPERKDQGRRSTISISTCAASARAMRSFTTACSRRGRISSAGRVSEITTLALTDKEEGKLIIRVEDTLLGAVRRIPVDMAILARRAWSRASTTTGWPKTSTSPAARTRSSWSATPSSRPVSSFSDGIFLAGNLPGAERHPGHGRPGRRGGRGSPGPGRFGQSRARAHHGRHRRRALLGLPALRRALPVHGHHL